MFCIWVMDKFSPVSKMAVYGANVPRYQYSYALTTVRPVAVPFRSRPVPFHATETPVFHTDIRAGVHTQAQYLLNGFAVVPHPPFHADQRPRQKGNKINWLRFAPWVAAIPKGEDETWRNVNVLHLCECSE